MAVNHGAGTTTAYNGHNLILPSSASPLPSREDVLRRPYLSSSHLRPASTTSSDDQDSRYDNWRYSPARSPYPPPVTQLKSEYPLYSFNMTDIAVAPSNDSTKHEYSDDARFDDSRSQLADGRIEMDQDEVDAIIRNKRKVRDPKACYACHRRKVKCDRNLPCDSCVKRDHPELCSYERPSKKKRITLSHQVSHGSDGNQSDTQEVVVNSGPNVTVPKEQWQRINAELEMLRSAVTQAQITVTPAGIDVDEPSASSTETAEGEGVHAQSTQMGTIHLGSRSVLAYMMGHKSRASQNVARSLLEENILPNLGLDNETATYPFVDLWSTDSSMQDVRGLCKALPDDVLCLSFWESYRDVACTIYPVVPDKGAFEEQLKGVLGRRTYINRNGLRLDPDKPYGVSMSWLALIFSVLASGAQCGTLPAKERELTSQVYICCAYQALRMANFLTHPCLETIQACLIIGNALAYNMNPGVAYIFLGMTLRSAFSMGIHVSSHAFSDHENYLRGRIWWALAWQDSHFSVSYDRPSSSIMCYPPIPYRPESTSGNRSYVETLSAIIRLTQDILRDRSMNPSKAMGLAMIQKYRDQINSIITDAMPRLKERSLCGTTIEHMERLAFQLHSSYMLSEICRPTLKEVVEMHSSTHAGSHTPAASPKQAVQQTSSSANSAGSSHSAKSPTPVSGPVDPNVSSHLRAECVKALENTVGAYVELHTISVFACRSWIGIQRSISAAFILGILPETRQEPRVLALLQKLEQCIAARASEDIGFDPQIDQLSSPMLQTARRMSVVNSGSRPGMSESPNWARSMTKSLNALGKLNATLAASSNYPQMLYPKSPMSQQQKITSSYIQQPLLPPQHQTPAGTYATPVVSPITHPTNDNNGPSGIIPPSMHPYSPIGLPGHLQASIPHSGMNVGVGGGNLINGAGVGGYRSGGLAGMGGPMTPEAGSNDWHYGNLTERALEYVQPGLWG